MQFFRNDPTKKELQLSIDAVDWEAELRPQKRVEDKSKMGWDEVLGKL